MMNTTYDCSVYELPRIKNRAGNLTPIHNNLEIPFAVKRVFYLYDVPGGESRGAHSHKECHQFLIAASGSFEVLLDDSKTKRIVQLNRPYVGLHIPPGIWASEINFSPKYLNKLCCYQFKISQNGIPGNWRRLIIVKRGLKAL